MVPAESHVSHGRRAVSQNWAEEDDVFSKCTGNFSDKNSICAKEEENTAWCSTGTSKLLEHETIYGVGGMGGEEAEDHRTIFTSVLCT